MNIVALLVRHQVTGPGCRPTTGAAVPQAWADSALFAEWGERGSELYIVTWRHWRKYVICCLPSTEKLLSTVGLSQYLNFVAGAVWGIRRALRTLVTVDTLLVLNYDYDWLLIKSCLCSVHLSCINLTLIILKLAIFFQLYLVFGF